VGCVTALAREERVARGFLAGAAPLGAVSVSCAFAALSTTLFAALLSAVFFVARLRTGFADVWASITAVCDAGVSAIGLAALSLLVAGFARGARLRVVLTAPSSGACAVCSVS
jgi:hypothetical protein